MDPLPSPEAFDLGPYRASMAKRLPMLRARAKLSQAELAEASGVGHRTIKKIEAGIGNPELETLLRLQQVLGVSTLEEFFGELPSQRPN